MRITNSTILRGYNRSLNTLANQKTDSMYKILSGRSFSRASENPLSAAKALNVRKQLYNTAQYKENLSTADKFYTEAETSLLQVSEELSIIRETIIAAVNTTKDNIDLDIYAQQLETKGEELCSVFNTDSAGRVIFGGESNSQQPFTISYDSNGNASEVLYHGVPINAYSDPSSFPYSNDVYVDIGLGMVINQDTQQIDPQSALRISFNGAEVSGCGAESGYADIDLTSLKENCSYSFNVYAGGIKKTVEFYAGSDPVGALDKALQTAYQYETVKPSVDKETGIISIEDGTVCVTNNANADPNKFSTAEVVNQFGYTDSFKIDLDSLVEGNEYSVNVTVGSNKQKVTFTAGADADATAEAINTAMSDAFQDLEYAPHVGTDGLITVEGNTVTLSTASGSADISVNRETTYSNNYIQLTLDAAKALRNGDIDYANGCIDRIVTATENLLVRIADLGCQEEFIEFNTNRLDTRELNLKERQDDLEAVDPKSEITLLKTYEAMYNACLQMSSMVISNSIFNYI